MANKKMLKYNKRKTMIIAILIIIGAIGISYALFSVIVFNNGTVYTTTGRAKNTKPVIELVESNAGFEITNTFPMTDTEGKNTQPFTFDVVNRGAYSAKYDLILETKSDNTLPNSLVKTYFNNTTKLLTAYTTTTSNISGYSSAYVLQSNVVIAAGATKSYNLYAWVIDTATTSNAQNKTWISKVRLVATPAE